MNIEQYSFGKFSARNEWEKSWERKSLSNQWSPDLLFSTATRERLRSGVTTVRWSGLIPSPPITSSRGAADTTAGRIYFSTPSAQVGIPVGDLVSPPPPHLCSHYTTGVNSVQNLQCSKGSRAVVVFWKFLCFDFFGTTEDLWTIWQRTNLFVRKLSLVVPKFSWRPVSVLLKSDSEEPLGGISRFLIGKISLLP